MCPTNLFLRLGNYYYYHYYTVDWLNDCFLTEAPEQPGCNSNEECSPTEACVHRICINPCAVASPCAISAQCEVINHKASCICQSGLIGDPFVRCYEGNVIINSTRTKCKTCWFAAPTGQPECTSDLDCLNDKACIGQSCQDPCLLTNPCGTNAQCKTIQHRPTCLCPDGWGGNPQVLCYQRKCLFNLVYF